MPDITSLSLNAFEDRGVEARPFLQGMLNRLGFGKARYERSGEKASRSAEDMALSAILSIETAIGCNKRERMIDAANYCFLAYRRMPDTGTWDGESPGFVEDGIITGARGSFEPTNGLEFHGKLPTRQD